MKDYIERITNKLHIIKFVALLKFYPFWHRLTCDGGNKTIVLIRPHDEAILEGDDLVYMTCEKCKRIFKMLRLDLENSIYDNANKVCRDTRKKRWKNHKTV